MINKLILGCLGSLIFVLNNILALGNLRSAISHLPWCFCPWAFFQNIGFNMVPSEPLYVTSRYSTKIFYRGVSGLETDCSCGIWCRGLTTCLLYVRPLFGNRLLSNSWAVGWTKWTMTFHFFVFWHMVFRLYLCILNNVLYFIKYYCTNISINVVLHFLLWWLWKITKRIKHNTPLTQFVTFFNSWSISVGLKI